MVFEATIVIHNKDCFDVSILFEVDMVFEEYLALTMRQRLMSFNPI